LRVLLAGATGTLGRPLVRELLHARHEVVGIARSAEAERTLEALGAEHVRADVMDRDALLSAVAGSRADAVIHELTALKKLPVQHRDMRETNRLRIEGTANLIEAARIVGATRFLTQSIFFGYGYLDRGDEVLTEQSDFGRLQGNKFDEHLEAMVSTEKQTLEADGIEGVALRYGLFYGADAATMIGMLKKRMLPVPAGRSSTIGFIHHEDAATATVAALDKAPGGSVYNIVDNEPTTWNDFIRAASTASGAPQQLSLPGSLLRLFAPYGGAMMTRVGLRVSNARAKAELGWSPRYPTVAEGFRAAVSSRAPKTTR
jgi:nucleoside-diphosphate-sugar epimerase